MSCERYWREGIVLVEHGQDDPHRASCEDCTRAHAARQELIDALPLVGAGAAGDPHWQAKVWQRIGEQRARTPRRWQWQWQLSSALAVACVLALWIGRDRRQTEIDVIAGDVPMRSRAAHVDDRLRVKVGKDRDVWIYCADRLVRACRAQTASPGCTPDSRGMVVELQILAPETHRVLVVHGPGAPEPREVLDETRALLESAGVPYEDHRVPVR